MSERRRLPNRRRSVDFALAHGGMHYTVSVGRFDNGASAEVFAVNHKNGSDADAAIRDASIITSISMQYGVPLDVLRNAVCRDPRGNPLSAIGAVLDAIAEGERR